MVHSWSLLNHLVRYRTVCVSKVQPDNIQKLSKTHRNSPPKLSKTNRNSPKLTTELSKTHRNSPKRSERVILNTYGVECPPINGIGSTLKHAKSDGTAEQILKIFHPAKLQGYKPLKVQADGNCFYRAVSLGCFGTEKFHTLLRMLLGIEVLLHPTAYGISHNEYIEIFENPYLAHYSYGELCEGILKDGAHSCMLAVACTNYIIGKGITTYCPPTAVPKLLSNPLTKEVKGRGVKESPECAYVVNNDLS
ncbi:hypothetical protein PoB_007385500 [Plakobranchus ocellatus]|uniref:OTU domain-containing protein n=1 Tax=Plakobranchus ocellatus TaxID=259542 RepID=A0AAV4DT75_9GAST|nr:hypothetical protein PoB_007385500 [Plakobranchus ocellatus]